MNALIESSFAESTGEVWLPLLTLSHPALPDDIRVVYNTEPVTSRGEIFLDFPFDVRLPSQQDDAPSRARITIDNVSREIGQAIRQITTPLDVLIEIIRAADPDTVEKQWPNFTMRNVRWDAGQVSGDLVLEDFTEEPYPAGRFTPASFPGLY